MLPLNAVLDPFPHAAEFTLSVLCSGDFPLQSRYTLERESWPETCTMHCWIPREQSPPAWRSKPLWNKFLRDLLSAVHIVEWIHCSSPCLCIAVSPGWHLWQKHENCTCAASGRWRQRKSVLCLWDSVPRQLYFHIQSQANWYYCGICFEDSSQEMELEFGFSKIKESNPKNSAGGFWR